MKVLNVILLVSNMVIVWSISSNRRRRRQTSMISVRVLEAQKKKPQLFIYQLISKSLD